MIVLAAFYPQGTVHATWLLLSLGAVVVGMGFRRWASAASRGTCWFRG